MVNGIAYDFAGNPELADLMAAETARTGPLALAHQVATLPVEYGTIVPMHYMNKGQAFSVVPVASPVFASVDENKRFGEAVRRAVAKSKNKVAILASGSLSHQLFPNSQLGPKPGTGFPVSSTARWTCASSTCGRSGATRNSAPCFRTIRESAAARP